MLLELQLSGAEIVQGGHVRKAWLALGAGPPLGQVEAAPNRAVRFTGESARLAAHAIPFHAGHNETRPLSLPVKLDVRSGGFRF
jgi:hypothetical protein